MPKKTTSDALNAKCRISPEGDLLIYGDVGDWWEGNDAMTIVDELESMEGDTINVRINSGGGLFVEGLAIYNRLAQSKKTVNVFIDGIAASMASVIAMAGDHVAMPSNTWLMIHKPRSPAFGTSDELRRVAETIDGFESSMNAIYMNRFNGTEAELSALLAAETWINAETALAWGLIDEIVAPVKAAARVDVSDFTNPPKELDNLFESGTTAAATIAKRKSGDVPMPKKLGKDAANEEVLRGLCAKFKLTEAETQAIVEMELDIEGAADEIVKTLEARAPKGGQQPPDPKPDAAAIEAAVTAALAEQAKTNREIRALCAKCHLTEAETVQIMDRGLSAAEARDAILDVVARRDAGNQPRSYVTNFNDTNELRASIATGLMVKAGVQDAGEKGNEFTVMSLIDIAREVLVANGISVRGMSANELATVAMHSTSDFPNILADVANKSLRRGYDAYPRTFIPFCRKVTASDFKNINRVQLGEAPALEKVNEKGEYKYGTMTDGKESYSLATYGKIIAITRKTIINDDLDALTRIPQSFGDAAADLENSVVWGLITSNAKLSDNVALFHANHSNLGSAAVISVNSLTEGRAAMRKQKAMNGTRPLNLKADFLIVPAALETVAQQFLASTVVPEQAANVNPFAGSMQPIVEPLLDDSSITAWYLAASPSRIDTIEYAYLAGNEGVFIETRDGFNVDGVEIKAMLDFGAGLIDYRGMFKNAGA